MAIDPAAASTAAQSAAGSSTSSPALGRARLAENFDTFLSLLTTQLKNQDPLSPMDSNAFTQQIVQMTGVEQQLLTNDLLQKLVGNTSGGLSTAVSLIGKQVRAVTDETGLANGQAKWVYKLDGAAANVKLEVLDSTGKVVATKASGAAAAGDNTFTWDGKDVTGRQLPDGGTYKLRVTALDPAGAAVTSTTFVEGVVTGVEQVDGKSLLTINRGKVAWDLVSSVSEPPAATQTATTNTTNNTNNPSATQGTTGA
jgi:flagellar basal-body rod modification protein FlgD